MFTYLSKPAKVLLIFVFFIVCKIYRKIKIKITIELARGIIYYLGGSVWIPASYFEVYKKIRWPDYG